MRSGARRAALSAAGRSRAGRGRVRTAAPPTQQRAPPPEWGSGFGVWREGRVRGVPVWMCAFAGETSIVPAYLHLPGWACAGPAAGAGSTAPRGTQRQAGPGCTWPGSAAVAVPEAHQHADEERQLDVPQHVRGGAQVAEQRLRGDRRSGWLAESGRLVHQAKGDSRRRHRTQPQLRWVCAPANTGSASAAPPTRVPAACCQLCLGCREQARHAGQVAGPRHGSPRSPSSPACSRPCAVSGALAPADSTCRGRGPAPELTEGRTEPAARGAATARGGAATWSCLAPARPTTA